MAIDPVTGGMILGGVGMVGSFLGQSSANRANAREADKQRQWLEMMNEDKHQIEVADMKLAGLNPMLAAGVAKGASGGGAAVHQSTTSGAGQLAGTALEAIRVKKELKATDSQVALNTAQALAAKQTADTAKSVEQQNKELTKQLKLQTPTIQKEQTLKQMNIETDSKYQGVDQFLKRGGQVISTAKDAAVGIAAGVHAVKGGGIRMGGPPGSNTPPRNPAMPNGPNGPRLRPR